MAWIDDYFKSLEFNMTYDDWDIANCPDWATGGGHENITAPPHGNHKVLVDTSTPKARPTESRGLLRVCARCTKKICKVCTPLHDIDDLI